MISKSKETLKNNNNISLISRLFPMKKGSKLLFISSYYSKLPSDEIVTIVNDEAVKKNCNIAIHAGWSFKRGHRKKLEDKELIIKSIRRELRNSPIETYIAEIGRNYYIFQKKGKNFRTVKCTPQLFAFSNQYKYAENFVKELESIKPRKIAKNKENPCILVVCGENNLFNKRNRKNARTIKSPSISGQFLDVLRRIQDVRWNIINPSHLPYGRPETKKSVMAFHHVASKSKEVNSVITGNNRAGIRLQSLINNPLIWKTGTPLKMEYVLEDRLRKIHIAIGRI